MTHITLTTTLGGQPAGTTINVTRRTSEFLIANGHAEEATVDTPTTKTKPRKKTTTPAPASDDDATLGVDTPTTDGTTAG